MRIVLDTNIVLVMISSKSPHHMVFRHLLDGNYRICVTTEILNEYAEIIEEHMGSKVSEAVLEAFLALPNIEFVNVYFRFHVLADEDDNKFVDCAVASNASFLVSEDRGFRALKKLEFPKIEVIQLETFKKLLAQNDTNHAHSKST